MKTATFLDSKGSKITLKEKEGYNYKNDGSNPIALGYSVFFGGEWAGDVLLCASEFEFLKDNEAEVSTALKNINFSSEGKKCCSSHGRIRRNGLAL